MRAAPLRSPHELALATAPGTMQPDTEVLGLDVWGNEKEHLSLAKSYGNSEVVNFCRWIILGGHTKIIPP